MKYDLFRAPAVLKPRQLNLKCGTQNVGHKLREVFKKKNVYKAVRLTGLTRLTPSPEAVRKM